MIIVKDKISNKIYDQINNFENFSLYHTKYWHEFVKKTFNWEVNAVIGMNNKKIIFLLPYISKFRIDLKKHNICFPFSHKAGLIYDRRYKDKINDFYSKLNDLFNNFEIRDTVDNPNFHKVITHKIVLLNLKKYKHEDELFNNFNKKGIQRNINKALQSGVMVKQENTYEAFNKFYEMKVDTRLRQGSPVYPKSFFYNLYDSFKETDYIKLYLAYYNNKAVAGSMFFHYNNAAIYAYGASVNNREYFKIGINQIVLWRAVKEAFHQNLNYIDFGRSHISNDDLIKYKLKWGGTSFPLSYSFLDGKKGKINPIKRGSKFIKTASLVLKYSPRPIFKLISPYLLRIII